MIATPARPHRLCAAAIATWGSWPFIMVAYWTGVLESGVLPPDGDTVLIPVVEGFALTVLLSPFFALVLWASLRRYPGAVPLFVAERSIGMGVDGGICAGLRRGGRDRGGGLQPSRQRAASLPCLRRRRRAVPAPRRHRAPFW